MTTVITEIAVFAKRRSLVCVRQIQQQLKWQWKNNCVFNNVRFLAPLFNKVLLLPIPVKDNGYKTGHGFLSVPVDRERASRDDDRRRRSSSEKVLRRESSRQKHSRRCHQGQSVPANGHDRFVSSLVALVPGMSEAKKIISYTFI